MVPRAWNAPCRLALRNALLHSRRAPRASRSSRAPSPRSWRRRRRVAARRTTRLGDRRRAVVEPLALARQGAVKRTSRRASAPAPPRRPLDAWTSPAARRRSRAVSPALVAHTRSGEVGRDHRLAHARRHALRAERRRDDAAGVDDEDVHVGRRARSVRPGLHVLARRAARRRDRRRRHADRQPLPARRRRSVAQPRFWHDQNPMDVARAADRGRGHQARAAATSSATRPRSTTSSFPTAGRRATSAPRTRRACRRCRSTRISCGSRCSRTATRRSVTLEPATTTIPRREHRATSSAGRGGRISARAPARRSDHRARHDRRALGPAQVLARRRQSRRCSPPARCAPSLQKAGITVDGQTRLGAVAGERRRRSRRSRRRRSRRSSARWIARASTSSPSCSSAPRRTRRRTSPAPPRRGSRTCATSCRRRSARAVGRGRVRRQRLSLLDSRDAALDGELLGYVHHADWGPAFHAALPVEGESGTLKRRARGTPARGNLHAKTGTTNTVAALGGYVTAKNGEVLAFSLHLQRRRPLERQGGDGSDRRDDGGVRPRVGRSYGRREMPRQVARAVAAAALLTHALTISFDLDPALPQLGDVRLGRNALVGRVHARRLTSPRDLHQPRDRQRVARRPHHRADAVLLVVAVDELEATSSPARRPSCPSTTTRSATRSRPFGFVSLGRTRRDERVARHDLRRPSRRPARGRAARARECPP